MATSQSSKALNELLDEQCPEADAVREKVHRTVLWRYRTGKRKPDAEMVATLAQLTKGRVPANGWTDDTKSPAKPDPLDEKLTESTADNTKPTLPSFEVIEGEDEESTDAA